MLLKFYSLYYKKLKKEIIFGQGRDIEIGRMEGNRKWSLHY